MGAQGQWRGLSLSHSLSHSLSLGVTAVVLGLVAAEMSVF